MSVRFVPYMATLVRVIFEDQPLVGLFDFLVVGFVAAMPDAEHQVVILRLQRNSYQPESRRDWADQPSIPEDPTA